MTRTQTFIWLLCVTALMLGAGFCADKRAKLVSGPPETLSQFTNYGDWAFGLGIAAFVVMLGGFIVFILRHPTD